MKLRFALKTLVSVSALALVSWNPSLAQPPRTSPQQKTPPPFVSPIFGDHMVLQRGRPNPAATATAQPDGKWVAKIDPPAPGGPYKFKISRTPTLASLCAPYHV